MYTIYLKTSQGFKNAFKKHSLTQFIKQLMKYILLMPNKLQSFDIDANLSKTENIK